MLYLVRMDVDIPLDMPREQAEATMAEEREYSQQLQRDRRWVHLWRVVGSTPTTPCSRWQTMTNCTPCFPICPCFGTWRSR